MFWALAACCDQEAIACCSSRCEFENLCADEAYADDGPYDPAEHSPMYDVDMEDRTAVFDLAMEDDSDDGGGLLDWSILAGRQCCTWTPIIRKPA